MKKNKILAETKTHLQKLIENEISQHGLECDLNHIDVSLIDDLSYLFSFEPFCDFNGNISQWNVSNVVDMEAMFCCSLFNGDISQWNVSKVQTMEKMFDDCWFNGEIFSWNVSNVTTMKYMFFGSDFDKKLDSWIPSSLENSIDIFHNSKCIVPYWANLNSNDKIIKEIDHYQLLKNLHQKITDDLNDNNSKNSKHIDKKMKL